MDPECVCPPVGPLIEINGVPVHAVTPRAAMERVETMLLCPATHVMNHIPADPIVIARRSLRLRQALQRADLNVPDGMGVVWASRALGVSEARERVYGPDFMLDVMRWGVERGLRHGLVGGSEETLGTLIARLEERVSGVLITTKYSPPMREISDDGVREDVSMLNGSADIVWVGLGTPKQQLWAEIARADFRPRIISTVGAAFDFLAGLKPQAPAWMQRNGLEWLFRLRAEPWRLARRYLVGNPVFIWSVFNSRSGKAEVRVSR